MLSRTLAELIELSKILGEPARQLVLHYEGNTSAKIDGKTFFVKGTGKHLSTAQAADFTTLHFSPLLDLIAKKPNANPQQIRDALEAAAGKGPAPSRESFFHALLLELPGIRFVAHTHPTFLMGIMTSPRAEAFAHIRLFPDHVHICGPRSLYLPYMDPGLPLAVELSYRLEEYLNQYGDPPSTILLGNYGMIALGTTSQAVLAATTMMQKAATIYITAQACGGAHPMPDEHVRRLLHKTS